MTYSAVRLGAVALLAIVLVGCASRTRAPVEDRTASPATVASPAVAPAPPLPATEPESRMPTYTVKRGDTLYQIALDHGLDYKDLAAWNSLENPNKILIGQVLRVAAPGEASATGSGVTTSPLKVAPAVTEAKPGAASGAGTSAGAAPAASSATRNADNYKSSPKAFKEPYSEQALRDVARAPQAAPETVALAAPSSVAKPEPPRIPAPAPAADTDDEDKIDWVWPAKGKVVVGFSENANLKGIDIAGASGEPVIASAGGKVVYVGNGLRGYGKLVIVKHNKTWLSAYAHNREILVKEGQQVTKGQKIAEMGNTDADTVKLHFEIRRLGKPVDPARYLPAG
jgi:lipoprotein NlpD